MNYNIPQNLLSINNAKTIKGRKKNFETYILYLAPHTQNSKGVNLCSHASKGCAKACLFGSGSARFNNVQNGKINKTEYFLDDRKSFLNQLDKEISNIKVKHSNKNTIPVFRLNGTSDIPFEKLKIRDGKNIFELHSDVQFYDYTKNPIRITKSQPENYHLTFSMNEDNKDICFDLLEKGYNVSAVFAIKKTKPLPKTYKGYKVVDGDISDLRFLDERNVIVGLRYKKMTYKGASKVNHENINENDFIINV